MRVNYTPTQLVRMRDRCPRTRRELLSYLWFGLEFHHVNIYKEGTEWTCHIERTIHATYLRTIDALTFGQWADRITARHFPF